jgi:hypothetical protein
MLDVLFVAIILALFGLTVVFIGVCDRIIGSDEEAFAGSQAEPRTPPTATAPEKRAA